MLEIDKPERLYPAQINHYIQQASAQMLKLNDMLPGIMHYGDGENSVFNGPH